MKGRGLSRRQKIAAGCDCTPRKTAQRTGQRNNNQWAAQGAVPISTGLDYERYDDNEEFIFDMDTFERATNASKAGSANISRFKTNLPPNVPGRRR